MNIFLTFTRFHLIRNLYEKMGWGGGFPSGLAGKESVCNEGDLGSIPGEENGSPLQYSGLENSKGCVVQGLCCPWVAKSRL